MPGAQSILLSASRLVPGSLVRIIGRRRSGIFRLAHAAARAATAGPTRVQRGFAAGLEFDSGAGGPSGFALGTWEPEVQDVLLSELRAGSVVWDIGAAQGFHAVAAARAVGTSGQVVAVEPYAPNAALVRRNVALNNLQNVDIHELGIGAEPGWAMMVDKVRDAVSVEMHPIAAQAEGAVRVTTLDALFDDGVRAPNLILMDVEGAEADVLRGGREVITRARPTLVIEVHDTWDDVRAVLREFGYDPSGVGLENRATATSVHVVTRPAESQARS